MSEALPIVLLEAALKGAAIFVIVALVAPLLRRRSAAVRHAVWCFAVCAQLLLPALALVAPQWHVPLLKTETLISARAVLSPSVIAAEPRVPTQGVGQLESPTVDAERSDASRSVADILAVVWLIGAGLVFLHLVIGTIGVWRLAVRGHRVLDAAWLTLTHDLAVRLGISRPLTLLEGDALAVPMTWGVIYPVVLLPAGAESWDDEQRRYVLVHEMAHVRRFDALTHLIGQVTLALFWFDPFVWFAVARMRAEREHACDDYVLQAGTTPSRYADDLLEMVQSIGLPNHPPARSAFAALAMARRSEFEGRMLAILNDETERAPLSRRSVMGGAAAAVVVALGLAGFSPLAAREAATPAAVATPPATSEVTQTKRARDDSARVGSATRARAEPTSLDRVLASIPPDGAKTAILSQYVVSGDTARLTAALRAVPSLSTDGQKNVVLANAARPALSGGEVRLLDAYFDAVRSMTSDNDLGAVLVHASANGNGSPAVTTRILRAAKTIRSPGPASMVLINVAARNLVSSDSIRDVYLRMVSTLPSGDARKRALTALLAVQNGQSHKP